MRGADRRELWLWILAALIVVAIAVYAVSRARHTMIHNGAVLSRAQPSSASGWMLWWEDEALEDCEGYGGDTTDPTGKSGFPPDCEGVTFPALPHRVSQAECNAAAIAYNKRSGDFFTCSVERPVYRQILGPH